MNKIISIVMSLIAFITGYFSFLFPQKDDASYVVYSDISYGTQEREYMDIYVPDEAHYRGENGCILFIHGGSWSNGDKKEMASRCIEMAEKGYITATMNYTLYSVENSSYFTVDIMLDEIGRAIERIKKFSDDENLNIAKLATSGFSSGGHISMLYSYSRKESSSIELVFTANMVSPSDLSYEIWGDLGIVIVNALTGSSITKETVNTKEAKRIIASVSPVTYVTKNTIPSLFSYGGKDPVIPKGNRESVIAKFDSVGATYRCILYPDSIHTLLNNPEEHEIYMSILENYCRTYFGH